MGYVLVVQMVVNFMFVYVYGSQFVGNGVEVCFIIKIVEFVGVKQDVFFGQCLFGEIWFGVVGSEDNWFNVQIVFVGEFVVVLVVIWNGYYCVGVVFYQYKVCCLDWNLFIGQWMNGFKVGIDVFFFYCCYVGFGYFGIVVFVDKGGQCWIVCCSLLCQWVICCDGQVGIIYKGVWMGGVDSQFVSVVVDVKGDFYFY